MEAGRDLDALVAEKVMGWKRELTPSGYLWFSFGGHPLANAIKGPDCPPFSTDIAAAWEAVEKVTSTESYTMEITPSKFHGECTVSIRREDEDGDNFGPFYFTEKAAPHAICLAALKAVNAL